MSKKSIILTGAMLVVPVLLWLAGQGFGYGPGFDKPSVPGGAKVQGPAAKGMIMYKVNAALQTATIEFHGECTVGKGRDAITHTINTQTADVSLVTDENAFLTGTAQDIAQSVEGFFITQSAILDPLKQCWPNAFGVYVQAINGAGAKDNTGSEWAGEATLKGVFGG